MSHLYMKGLMLSATIALMAGLVHFDSTTLKPGDFAFAPRGKAVRMANPWPQTARFLHWSSTPRNLQSN